MRKSVLLVASMVLAVLLACGVALAAAGDLDRTFGGDGRVTTKFGEDAQIQLSDLIAQPDGKLVAAGWRSVLVDFDTVHSAFVLTRYRPNGSLDSSFGRNGRVLTGHHMSASALARQGDGKLVAAGSYSAGEGFQGTEDFALARYNPNGSLDRSFGDDGKVITTFKDGFAHAWDLVVQPDGKLLVAGKASSISGGDYLALARYNTDGSLDRSFGEGGKVLSDFYTDEHIEALVLQPDGKIVTAGDAFVGQEDGAYHDFLLARYNPDGSLDRSFGRGGRVTTSLGSRYDEASALVLQPDGKLVVGGCSGGEARRLGGGKTAQDFALIRYKRDGSLDGTFGRRAKVTTDFRGVVDQPGDGGPTYECLGDLVLLSSGKLVAAGGTSGNFGSRFALARYHPSGALDETFGKGGKKATEFPGFHYADAGALARQGDGKLVAAGIIRTLRTEEYSFGLARYER